MIIGDAFQRLFAGLKVDIVTDSGTIERDVQCHYGDHKELVKWISLKNKGNQPKYPLIWYVVAPYTEHNGFYESKSKLIIVTDTKLEWLNTTRNVKTYTNIINPVWEAAKGLILSNKNIDVYGKPSLKFEIKDEPNYGVEIDDIRLSQNDFSSLKNVGQKAISLDLVDGRVINFTFRIKADCIN